MLDLRENLTIESEHDYYALIDVDEWRIVNSRNLFATIGSREPETEYPYMGIRLSSGMLGELDCPAVAKNPHAPKDYNEVIFGIGSTGVAALIEFGGLPCPACQPAERLLKMGEVVTSATSQKLGSVAKLSDKNFLSERYDARRLDWETLTSFGVSPSQFTTQSNLSPEALTQITNAFIEKNLPTPDIGYYDATLQQRVSYCE